MSSPKRPRPKLLRKGRRIVGKVYTLSGGEQVFLANKATSDVERSGAKTISEAVRDDTAGWSLDTETLYKLRADGIGIVGVRCRDTGDLWLTRLEKFLEKGKLVMSAYSSRRMLPFSEFSKRAVATKL